MTVFENVLVGATFGGRRAGHGAARHGGRGARARRHARRAPTCRAGALTLLERKRLELARALATGPRVLLLDEIAGGLTEAEVHELVDTITAIQATGVAIIWIEHIVHALLRGRRPDAGHGLRPHARSRATRTR